MSAALLALLRRRVPTGGVPRLPINSLRAGNSARRRERRLLPCYSRFMKLHRPASNASSGAAPFLRRRRRFLYHNYQMAFYTAASPAAV